MPVSNWGYKPTPMELTPPASEEVADHKEYGGLGETIDSVVQWYLFWLKVGGEYQWMWHRARLQWCKRDDVGWVPMALAECTKFKFGDHVWHGPFPAPVADVVAINCDPCRQHHNTLAGRQNAR